MFVFIAKAQPLASGMFLCHFQILCGVPADSMDMVETEPGQGFRDSLWLFLAVKLWSLEPSMGVRLHPDRTEFKPRGPPAQTPESPEKEARLRTDLSTAP